MRSDFSTRLLGERDLQAKARSLARPVFTGPNSVAHVPLKGRQAGLPKGRWLCDESQTPGGARPSLEVHVPVAVYLGPGGPAVTGKDWAKSLSLSLSLSLHLSRCVLVFKSCVSLWLFFVVSQFCRPYTRLFHSRLVRLELLWCSRFFRCGRFFEVPCCVGDV